METGVRPWYRRPYGIVAILVLLPILIWIVWFLWQLVASLWLLQRGGADPLADLQKKTFEASVAKSFQQTDVRPENLAKIASGDYPQLGNAEAVVTIVEFMDWDCPYCRQTAPMIRTYLSEHPDRVNFVLRDFPLTELHPQARIAALAGRCVYETAEAAVFWEYHDRLFATQGAHAPADLRRYAKDLGVDLARYDACLTDPKTGAKIDGSLEEGKQVGVGATPTFFFNGVSIPGAIDAESFEIIVQAAEKAATR